MPYSNSGVTHYTVNGTGLVSKWTVCKYADGVIEIYARTSSSSIAMTTTYGNGFYAETMTQAIPSGIFTSVDYASIHRCGGSTSNGLISVSLNNLTTTEIKWYTYNTTSSTLNVAFAIHIIGRWDGN